MQVSAKTLCKLLEGQLEGDPDVKVSRPSKIEEGQPGTISFLANLKYEPFAYTTRSSILLVPHDWQPSQPVAPTLIRVSDVYDCMASLLNFFERKDQHPKGIAAQADIAPTAKISEDVSVGNYSIVEAGASIDKGSVIYPQVFIGRNVQIGRKVILYPGVRVYHDCIIGDQCVIHANAVIGSDGFGFTTEKDGSYKKIPQLGNVVLEPDVEVGANTVIDRATMGSTLIKRGTKLDNLIQIAHNVEIGAHSALAAQVGVAGSTKIGERVQIGGQGGIVGHIKIGDEAKIQAQSGVNRNLDNREAVFGSPAIPYRDYLKAYAIFRNLPALLKQLHALEKRLRILEER